MAPRIVGVVDIGKTNAKVAVVDLDAGAEVAVRTTPNLVRDDGPYPHFDIEAIWNFVTGALSALDAERPLDAISVTTHGAAAALVADDGALALPVLDYEHPGPDELTAECAAVLPPFARSFTPPLPLGLTLGRQIFWQSRRFAEDFARTRWILPYPQYWSFRLTGVAASEITSLGCHTHLWDFADWNWSSLVRAGGWERLMPPLRPASDVLGTVTPALAERLGLRPGLPVFSGIHDSNASLLPHVLGRAAPYAVVSTGTWVVVCAPGGDLARLDPARDSLANIDALGHPVPSARFMGGREFSMLVEGTPPPVDEATLVRVLDEGAMLLPAVVAGCGPWPDRQAEWTVPRARLDPGMLHAVVSLYLALMTAECLALTGAAGPILVEGPFAANGPYLDMLAAATGRPVSASGSGTTGTAVGAAMLARMDRTAAPAPPVRPPSALAARMADYARAWRRRARRRLTGIRARAADARGATTAS